MASSYMWRDAFICDIWHDSFIRETWPKYICSRTHLYASHGAFTYMTWLMDMCDMTHSHDAFTHVTWLIRRCNTTHLYIWPCRKRPITDSFLATALPNTHKTNAHIWNTVYWLWVFPFFQVTDQYKNAHNHTLTHTETNLYTQTHTHTNTHKQVTRKRTHTHTYTRTSTRKNKIINPYPCQICI